MVAQGFNRDHPYCVAVVELDEGPHVVARIDVVDAKHPEDICIGMPLAIQLNEQEQEHTYLVFKPKD